MYDYISLRYNICVTSFVHLNNLYELDLILVWVILKCNYTYQTIHRIFYFSLTKYIKNRQTYAEPSIAFHSFCEVKKFCLGSKLFVCKTKFKMSCYIAIDTCISCDETYAGDAVHPRKGKAMGLKVFHRNHFSSALKRMSVVAGYTQAGSSDTCYIATVKGAPEIIREMVRNCLWSSRLY